MRSIAVVIATLAFSAACRKVPPEPPAPKVEPVALAASKPPSAREAAVPSGSPLTGKVIETIAAGTYTYLRLATGGGETWAAVPTVKLAPGAEVTVMNPMPMDGFESKTLGRKFEHIVFGTLGGAAPAAAAAGVGPGAPAGGAAPAAAPAPAGAAAADDVAAPHRGVASVSPAAAGEIHVPRAPGPDGKTVGDIFAQRKALKDAKVLMRGKVVKFSAGIMGRNWLHLRDGTGEPGKSDDLTVTTKDMSVVGEVVLVKGTVHLDRDFGAGYSYPVIVEDATISR